MKKILKAGFVLGLLFFAMLLSSCDQSSKSDEITKLSYNGEIISWSAVSGAKTYLIKINGKEMGEIAATSNPEYTYDAENNDFDFYIEAKLNRRRQENPTYSIKFKYIGTVKNVKLEDGKFVWDINSEADKYSLMINNEDKGFVSNNFYDVVTAGVSTIQVLPRKDMLVSETGNNAYYGMWSEKLRVEVLEKPTNIKYDSSKFTWENVTGASGYVIKIDNEEFSVVKNEFEYPAGTKDFNFTIKSKGNANVGIYDSTYLETKTYKYIEPVTNILVENGVLTWDKSNNALEYVIKINGVQLENSLKTNSYTGLQAGNGYVVEIKPIGSGDFTFSKWSPQTTITILTAPSIKYYDNQVVWNQIQNAIGYQVIVTKDGTLVDQKTCDERTFVYSYSFEEVGVYDVKVKANSESGTGVYESAFSNLMKVRRLDAPSQYTITDMSEETSATNITFVPVVGAESYEIQSQDVTISKSNNNTFIIGLSNLQTEELLNLKVISKGKNNENQTDVVLDSIKTLAIDITRLATPENFVVSENALTWNTVSNADGYIIVIDGNRYLTTTNKLTMPPLTPGNHNITVRAKGSGHNVITSNPSDNLAVKKLDTPKNISINNNILTWSLVNGATNYVVKIGTQEITATSNSFNIQENLSFISEGSGTQISVFALGNQKEILDSQASETKVISRLSKVSAISASDDNITWNQVTWNNQPVTRYQLYINGFPKEIVTGTSYSTTKLDVGQSKIQIVALGDQINTFDSEKSKEFIIEKLAIPTLTRSNNQYEWEQVIGTKGYEVMIGNTKVYSGNDLQYSPVFKDAGEYKVRIRAVGDNGITQVASNWYEITQRVSALSTPSFTVSVNLNEVTMEVTTNSTIHTGYIFNIGGIDNASSTNTYNFTNNGANVYNLKVKLVGNVFVNDVYYINSNYSNEQIITFLQKPSNVAISKQGGTNFRISWNAQGAETSEIEVILKDASGTVLTTYTSIQVSSIYDFDAQEAAQVEVKVKAKGNSVTTFDSDVATYITFLTTN